LPYFSDCNVLIPKQKRSTLAGINMQVSLRGLTVAAFRTPVATTVASWAVARRETNHG
jgi:hypothetical protein